MKYLNIFCVILYYNYSLIFFNALKDDILNVKSILVYLGGKRGGFFFFLKYNLFKVKTIFLKVKYIYFLCRSHKKIKINSKSNSHDTFLFTKITYLFMLNFCVYGIES
jgi:hypothetical protein